MLRAGRMVMLSRYCLADASRHRMTMSHVSVWVLVAWVVGGDLERGRVTALPISLSGVAQPAAGSKEDVSNHRIESNLIVEFNADSTS